MKRDDAMSFREIRPFEPAVSTKRMKPMPARGRVSVLDERWVGWRT